MYALTIRCRDPPNIRAGVRTWVTTSSAEPRDVQEPTAAALELAQSLKTPLKASDCFGIERLKLLLLSQGLQPSDHPLAWWEDAPPAVRGGAPPTDLLQGRVRREAAGRLGADGSRTAGSRRLF
eukprot:2625039-Rhodomonas_salina.2